MNETKTMLKEAIDEKAEVIISLVDDFVKQYSEAITKTNDGKKQFVDLIEAASQACCLDEFKLYIKYKGTKEGTRSLWGGIANPFIAQIDKLMNTVADEIVKDSEIVKLEVLKRFCGYLMWRTHVEISQQRGR